MINKRLIFISTLLCATIGYLAYQIREIDFDAFLHILLSSSVEGPILFIFFFVCTSLVHAFRLQLILSSFKSIPFIHLFHADNIANALSNLIPTTGEIFRFYFLSKTQGIPYLVNFGGLIFERLQFVAISAFSFIFLPISIMHDKTRNVGIALGVMTAVMIALTLFVNAQPERWRQGILWLFRRLSVFKALNKERANDLSNLVRNNLTPRQLLYAYGLTGLQCFLLGMRHYAIYLGFDYQIDFVTCVTAYVVIFLFMVIPTTPGRIGVFEVACLWVYHDLLGLPVDIVLAAVLMDRVLNIVALVGQTGYSLWKLDLSFFSLLKPQQSLPDQAADNEQDM